MGPLVSEEGGSRGRACLRGKHGLVATGWSRYQCGMTGLSWDVTDPAVGVT